MLSAISTNIVTHLQGNPGDSETSICRTSIEKQLSFHTSKVLFPQVEVHVKQPAVSGGSNLNLSRFQEEMIKKSGPPSTDKQDFAGCDSNLLRAMDY